MSDMEKLIALLVDLCKDNSVYEEEHAPWLADQLITKGVAPVVRCAECKWFDKGGNGVVPICTKHSGLAGAHELSFCSYGEKRDE